MKIGSFSAASNVTGLKSPVYDIASMLHRHNALAFFDYAAAAPYVAIDVQHGEESFFDGIFFSPHKFLGGPGGSGILIIHKRIYKASLPPTIAGGGTVDYVNAYIQEYSRDIEVREKAGTPGILQIYKAALAMELKEKIGIELIEKRENELLRKVLGSLADCPNIELVAPMDEEHNLPIPVLQYKKRLFVDTSAVCRQTAERSVRDPGQGRVLLRRTLRAPPSSYRSG